MSSELSPVCINGFFGKEKRYGLIGHGVVTNPNTCGKYRTKYCINVDAHNRRAKLLGLEERNMATRKRRHFSCRKPSCPVCYPSWILVESRNITRRLKASEKLHGFPPEHFSISAPVERYGSPDNYDHKKAHADAMVACKVRGIDGAMTWHGARFKKRDGVYRWEVHFHLLGFVTGDCGHDGYARCRKCRWNGRLGRGRCWECEGFEGLTRRQNLLDGMIVKVLDAKHERRSVFYTARYELDHATIDYSKKDFHTVTWFGSCSYRKLKVEPEKVKPDLCPLCGNAMEFGRYMGGLIFDSEASEFPLYEDGKPTVVINALYRMVFEQQPSSGSYG